jgi:hypothetical protein
MHWIDPAQLPAISGTIERFIANARAELDGLVLKVDGAGAKLVHFPSHMTGEVEAALNSGDVIIVRGLKPREAEMIAAIALERSDGLQIVDRGPPARAPEQGFQIGPDVGGRKGSHDAFHGEGQSAWCAPGRRDRCPHGADAS